MLYLNAAHNMRRGTNDLHKMEDNFVTQFTYKTVWDRALTQQYNDSLLMYIFCGRRKYFFSTVDNKNSLVKQTP